MSDLTGLHLVCGSVIEAHCGWCPCTDAPTFTRDAPHYNIRVHDFGPLKCPTCGGPAAGYRPPEGG